MASYLKITSVVDYLLLYCISVLCVQLDLLKEKYLLSQNPSRAEGWTIKIEQSKPNVHICSLPRSCRCPYNYLRETSSPANKTSRDKLLMATRRGKKNNPTL